MANRIEALNPDVVHKIAAGEIIVSPVNALKELIENSLDAGATNIEVIVKEGGHKLLQISDDGHGINSEDLPLLCQRFTTSKLKKFEDLETVQTLGFRGEALASISHISHLTVKSKVSSAQAATIAEFQNGKLVSTRIAAGNTGTQITVEDLFYNTPLRRKALKSSADSAEYQKIVDVITKYAIMYPGTFSCKRFQDPQPMVISASSQKEKLRKVYGSQAHQNLIELEIDEHDAFGVRKIEGWITGLNYSAKRSSPYIFFINKRLVTCEPLARAIRKVYQESLPKNSSHAIVFLNLELDTSNVDVNVHPTKREVHFLYDTEIIELVQQKISELLTQADDSRDFSVQSYITASTFSSDEPSQASLEVGPAASYQSFVSSTNNKPRYEYQMVRTDPLQPKLTSFIEHSRTDPLKVSPQKAFPRVLPTQVLADVSSELELESELPPDTLKKQVRDMNLTSINDLAQEIKAKTSSKLLDMFSKHTFVGVVDFQRGLAAIQRDVRLYLVEYQKMCFELFYQLSLTEFGNFGTVHLGDGIKLAELLQVPEAEIEGSECIELSMMLDDYFQIGLRHKDDCWYLCQLPLVLKGYIFPVSKIQDFVKDLFFKTRWEEEKECFHDILQALAGLHTPTSQTSAEDIELVFNSAKSHLVPSQNLMSTVIEIANLPGLYRVFERC